EPIFLFKYSFFDSPATAMISSRSEISTGDCSESNKASAYSSAKFPSSFIGEYFFKITSPSRSIKISSGSPSRILNVLLISFGISTRPKSSILRTIPVAFIDDASLSYDDFLCAFSLSYPLENGYIARNQEHSSTFPFISDVHISLLYVNCLNKDNQPINGWV